MRCEEKKTRDECCGTKSQDQESETGLSVCLSVSNYLSMRVEEIRWFHFTFKSR